MTTHASPVIDAGAYMAERAARAAAASGAYARLERDMQEAMLHDPTRVLHTPGWAPTHYAPAMDVLADQFAGEGDTSLREALSIIGAAARGVDVSALAQLWISVQAKKYAGQHCDEVDA